MWCQQPAKLGSFLTALTTITIMVTSNILFAYSFVILWACLPCEELFAVLSGSNCVENTNFGSQRLHSSGGPDHNLFSSNGAFGAIKHSYWLQIVTSNGVDELFRVYWTFSTPKTITQRVLNAVENGEDVLYRVIDSRHHREYFFNGLWRFDSGLTLLDEALQLGPANKGIWGAANGSIDGSMKEISPYFWGTDKCGTVYENGLEKQYGDKVKSFLYLSDEPFSNAKNVEVRRADRQPNITTRNPIDLSHFRRSLSTTHGIKRTTSLATPVGYELFAVVGGDRCANRLYYGPESISAAGSADGFEYYLSTNTAGRNNLHNRWLQIVLDGNNNEIFRITWVFQTYKTLANHIINAVTTGEVVTYTILYNGVTTVFSDATWRFSSTSAVSNSRFTATRSECCFSAGGGAWGAGTPTVNANVVDYGAQNFWGTGNFASTDEAQCDWVFAGGFPNTGLSPKSYMFYSQDGPPTVAPTAVPTTAMPSTARPSAVPTSARPSAIPTLRPTALPTTAAPTYIVTAVPTAVPSLTPSAVPTATPAPTAIPTTAQPSVAPSAVPTIAPTTAVPSLVPSVMPTFTPSTLPSVPPSVAPSAKPSIVPSLTPTAQPTPTPAPSAQPTTVEPSAVPSRLPTRAPSRAPTATPRPSYTPATELFAVIGSTSCAENLYFGPQAITTEGSADGVYRYFVSTSTASRNIPHNTWMQVVTSDGVNEVFRIFWTFADMKTLADRFVNAVQVGESVSYRVIESTGREYSFSGTWRFASNSGITATTFAVTESKCCFSADDAAWGGGRGVIDGANAQTIYNTNFWGMGNFDGDDSGCRAFYRNGRITTAPAVRSFMYYSASGSSTDRFNLKFQIDMVLLRMSAENYIVKKDVYENVLSKTVSSSLLGVSSFDVTDFTVSDATTARSVTSNAMSTISSSKYTTFYATIVPPPSSTLASSVARYLRGGLQMSLQTTTSNALVTCIVTLDSSVYTYYEMTQQFDTSIADGTFNSWMRDYANYLQIYELNTTTIQSATYTDISNQESSNKKSNFFTAGVIMGIVIGSIAVVCIIIYACAWFMNGGRPSDWSICRPFRQNSRVFVIPPPEGDVTSFHSVSDAEQPPAYPATATLQTFSDIDDPALVNTFVPPVVGVMAPDDSDLDEALAPEGYNRRQRNNNTRASDPRGASEIAWNQASVSRSQQQQLRQQQYEAELHPMDVVVPRAVVARHARNAPIVRAQIVHSDVPEAETASVNYGQYGSNVAVAEAFVPNS